MKPVLCKDCGKPLKPNRKLERLCSECEVNQ